MNVLTMLPTGYLWENVRTTLLVLAAGAGLGYGPWWFRPQARRLVKKTTPSDPKQPVNLTVK
jgi:hypothetical protein